MPVTMPRRRHVVVVHAVARRAATVRGTARRDRAAGGCARAAAACRGRDGARAPRRRRPRGSRRARCSRSATRRRIAASFACADGRSRVERVARTVMVALPRRSAAIEAEEAAAVRLRKVGDDRAQAGDAGFGCRSGASGFMSVRTRPGREHGGDHLGMIEGEGAPGRSCSAAFDER